MSAHHHHGPSALSWSFFLIAGFAVIEGIGGWWADSLALLGDAGHMVTDALALGLASIATIISAKPSSHRHSFGLARAEVVVALVNGALMIMVVIFIAIEAFQRLTTTNPGPISGGTITLIASIGLIINIVVAVHLHKSEQTLNTRAALLHVMGDLLGSVAALLAGAVILLTGWTPIDPLLSLLICILILVSSLRLLGDVLHVIMEGVPKEIDLPRVGRFMAGLDGIHSIHDLHIWQLGSGQTILSAHVIIHDIAHWNPTLSALQSALAAEYGIHHVTLQPETLPWQAITWPDQGNASQTN